MSFRCQICHEAQSNGTRPARVITELRDRERDAGVEIVKELNCCESCATVTVDVKKKRDEERQPAVGHLTLSLAEAAGVA